MLSVADALAAYARCVLPLPVAECGVADCINRVLAGAVQAQHDMPGFDQSAVDGYALHSHSTQAASEAQPLSLPLRLDIPAGPLLALPQLPKHSAARILTGAALPCGADTVVAQERVARVGEELLLHKPLAAGANIRRQGEELRAGTVVATAGQRVNPGLLAALVQAGLSQISVRRAPRLRILISGDELRPAGTPLGLGQIHDSNGPFLQALLRQWGYDVASVEHVVDDRAAVEQALRRARDECDLLLSCGGASVGDRDFMVDCAPTAGFTQVFWRVAQKPGKPLLYAVGGGCHWLALPGNPVAVLVGAVVHARRLLDLLEGVENPQPRWNLGRLASPLARDRERSLFLRMGLSVDDTGAIRLSPLPHQESHMLSNLASAAVLVHLPEGEQPAAADSLVRWIPLPG